MPTNVKPTLNKTSISFGQGNEDDIGDDRIVAKKKDGLGINKMHLTMAKLTSKVRANLVNIKDIERVVDANTINIEGIKEALNKTDDAVNQYADADKKIDDIQEDEQKKDDQKAKRDAAESLLEAPQKIQKKLGDSVNKGVDAVGKKTIGFLDRIKKFFMVIVGGWFAGKTIDLLNARAEGNTDMVNKIGKQLLVGTAAVGSVIAIATFGLGTVLSSIGSLIAVVGGLLLNPVTLTALLIALGVGGAIMGMMKAFSWFRQKKAGGKELRDAHKKNREKLKEMKDELGIAKDGKIKNADGKWVDVMEHGTEEQKAAWSSFKDEEKRLNGIRNDMNDEIDKKKKEYFKEVRANEPSKKDGRKEYWKEARADWKKTEEEIRNKHISRIESGADPDSVLKSKANDSTVSSSVKDKATDISQEVKTDETIVLPIKSDTPEGGNSGKAKLQGGTIKAENNDDFAVLYTKTQFNTP
tara:strand:+ start:832 stop:2238 length:1407 start_codon:yes stop_codon:yes gene_type:complete